MQANQHLAKPLIRLAYFHLLRFRGSKPGNQS
jgi:hypothetical protein